MYIYIYIGLFSQGLLTRILRLTAHLHVVPKSLNASSLACTCPISFVVGHKGNFFFERKPIISTSIVYSSEKAVRFIVDPIREFVVVHLF
jgi:hypothetical protein